MSINYARSGFVVEEVTQACNTQDCTAGPLAIFTSEYYGPQYFNDITEGFIEGQVCVEDDIEGACPQCKKPVVYKKYNVVTRYDFVKDILYCYGKHSNCGLDITKEQVTDAVETYKKICELNCSDFAADSKDRENVKELLIRQLGLKANK